jgi:hypothetical protein
MEVFDMLQSLTYIIVHISTWIGGADKIDGDGDSGEV